MREGSETIPVKVARQQVDPSCTRPPVAKSFHSNVDRAGAPIYGVVVQATA